MSIKHRKQKEYSSFDEFSNIYFNNYNIREKSRSKQNLENINFGKTLVNELIREIKAKITTKS